MAKDSHAELRTVAQEANRLGVSRSYLYMEIRESRFPHVRLGSRVLLDPAQVDRFLALRAVSLEDALARREEDGLS